jgi:soluble lytic murein transglycosylase-like protein
MHTRTRINVALLGACAVLSCASQAQPPASPYRLANVANEFRVRDDPALRLPGKTVDSPKSIQNIPEPALPELLADKPFSGDIESAARDAGLDPALVHALIHVESRHRQNAVSPKGALGLMQVLPDTAARYGIRNVLRSPKANLRAGTLYLRDLIRMFDDRLELALAAYNAGEGAVERYDFRIPPYPETRQYVRDVLAKYTEWRTPDVSKAAVSSAPPAAPAYTEYLAGTRLTAEYSAP